MTILLTSLAGCGDTADETTADTQGTETAPMDTTTGNQYEPDDLPADLTYDGETITTFGWSGPAAMEFFAEEMNGELVNDAIFQIRASAVFDFGHVFNESMNGMTYAMFRSAVSEGKDNWMSIYASNEKALNTALEKVVTSLVGEQ